MFVHYCKHILNSLSISHNASSLISSDALEELSIRAGIALSQKKAVQELTTEGEDEDFEQEYYALSAQVVSLCLE